jgi:hypothetical protein
MKLHISRGIKFEAFSLQGKNLQPRRHVCKVVRNLKLLQLYDIVVKINLSFKFTKAVVGQALVGMSIELENTGPERKNLRQISRRSLISRHIPTSSLTNAVLVFWNQFHKSRIFTIKWLRDQLQCVSVFCRNITVRSLQFAATATGGNVQADLKQASQAPAKPKVCTDKSSNGPLLTCAIALLRVYGGESIPG